MAICETLILDYLCVPLVNWCYLPSAIVSHFSSWFRFSQASTIGEETLLDAYWVVTLGLFDVTVVD